MNKNVFYGIASIFLCAYCAVGCTDNEDTADISSNADAGMTTDGSSDANNPNCGPPIAHGTLTNSISDILFEGDTATTQIKHKIDSDDLEDSCIGYVSVSVKAGGQGCAFSLTFAPSSDNQEFVLMQASLSADSFCPGWGDDAEGEYALVDTSDVQLNFVDRVPESLAETSCFPGELRMSGSATLRRSDGNEIELNLSDVYFSGDFFSEGNTEQLCPCSTGVVREDCSGGNSNGTVKPADAIEPGVYIIVGAFEEPLPLILNLITDIRVLENGRIAFVSTKSNEIPPAPRNTSNPEELMVDTSEQGFALFGTGAVIFDEEGDRFMESDPFELSLNIGPITIELSDIRIAGKISLNDTTEHDQIDGSLSYGNLALITNGMRTSYNGANVSFAADWVEPSLIPQGSPQVCGDLCGTVAGTCEPPEGFPEDGLCE